jgi:hypothetical protein
LADAEDDELGGVHAGHAEFEHQATDVNVGSRHRRAAAAARDGSQILLGDREDGDDIAFGRGRQSAIEGAERPTARCAAAASAAVGELAFLLETAALDPLQGYTYRGDRRSASPRVSPAVHHPRIVPPTRSCSLGRAARAPVRQAKPRPIDLQRVRRERLATRVAVAARISRVSGGPR